MAKCKNKVDQYVPWHYGYKKVTLPCGSTAIDGNPIYCKDCIEKFEKQYPQVWRHVPGDKCKHGTYIGDNNGPDCICGQCEYEELELPHQDAQTRAQNKTKICYTCDHLCCNKHYRNDPYAKFWCDQQAWLCMQKTFVLKHTCEHWCPLSIDKTLKSSSTPTPIPTPNTVKEYQLFKDGRLLGTVFSHDTAKRIADKITYVAIVPVLFDEPTNEPTNQRSNQ